MSGRAVVIVGRPNVGKSALFNRLSGKRIAIVHEEPGVTRDRLMTSVFRAGRRFDLVDTGGVADPARPSPDGSIESAVHRQMMLALTEAAVAVLVVDVETGLLPLDEAMAQWIRKAGCPAVVAVNKVDVDAREAGAGEFERLGFPVFAVSALHGRGLDDLTAAVLVHLPPDDAPAPRAAAEPLRVAVVGRPNVGKSSFINRLLHCERVIVSPIPGTTRDSVDVPFAIGSGPTARHYLLIDTAGMRPNSKIDSMVERFGRMRTERSVRRADVVVFMLDATAGPTAQDKQIGALILENRKGCVIAVNKWDLSTVSQREYGPAVLKVMPFLDFCPLVFVSANSGYNIRRSVDAVDGVAAQVRARLPTPDLTRTLVAASERAHLPAGRGRHLKVFYATQTGEAPLRVRVFVNHAEAMKPAHQAFFGHAIRKRFGLSGAPVVLEFTGRRPDAAR